MPNLQRFGNGESPVASAKLNLIVDALTGAGNTPVNHGGVNDAVNYALSVRNQDPAAGKAAIIYAPNGTTVLLQVTAAGVLASPDGVAAAAPVLTTGSSIPASQIAAVTWTTFAPTLTQGVAVAATINLAHYFKIGRRAEIFIQMTASAAGTAGQPIIVTSLPAAILPLTNNTFAVSGWGFVSGAPPRLGALVPFTSGQLEIQVDNNTGVLGVAPAVTLVNGTIVTMWGSWETAS